MCELLFAYLIINAIEVSPGHMRVEQLRYTDGIHTEKRILHVPTKVYLDCWDGKR